MITVHLTYTGEGDSALRFAREMEESGTAAAIRAESGNLGYAYYQPLDDPHSVLLIDSWADQAAIDAHHASEMMRRIAALREKYDLHMKVQRYVSADTPAGEETFIRK